MNIAKLPEEQRNAIEQDKKRWHDAFEMLRTMNNQQIARWLHNQKDDELREDMRRRLNTTRTNNKRRKRAA